MAGLREGDSKIEVVKLTSTCEGGEEAHFTCGFPEEGLPPLISVLEPREEDESEGEPRLMLLSAAQQTVSQVAVTARRLRPCVFGSMLESGGVFPLKVLGVPGVGMSRRPPLAALLEMSGDDAKGMLHVLPPAFILASYSRGHFYPESEIVVVTSGIGADSWSLKANVVFDCSERIDLDDVGFLYKCPSNEVRNLQHEGRVGRMDCSLVHHLADAFDLSSAVFS